MPMSMDFNNFWISAFTGKTKYHFFREPHQLFIILSERSVGLPGSYQHDIVLFLGVEGFGLESDGFADELFQFRQFLGFLVQQAVNYFR